MSLRPRFLLLMTVIFFGFVLVTWILSIELVNGINEKWAASIIERQVVFDKYRTLSPLLREIALARRMAADPDIIRMALDERNPAARKRGIAAMERYRYNFTDHSYFAALAPSGHYYFNDANNQYAGKQLRYVLSRRNAADKWFYATMAAGKDYQINLDPDVHLGVTKIWINVLIKKDGQVLGVIGTGIDLTGFLKETVSIGQQGVHNLFIDQNLAIQLDTNPNLIDYMSLAKDTDRRIKVDRLLKNPADLDHLRRAMQQVERSPGRHTTLWVDFDGAKRLLGVAYLPEVGWYDLTLMDRDILGLIKNHWLAPAVFGVVFLIALLTMAQALRRWILDPISALQTSVERVRQGHFDVGAPELAPGELADLSQAFASMARHVQDTNRELESKVLERTRELRRVVEEQNAILDNRLVGIATTRDREFVWANAMSEAILGYSRGELAGKPTSAIYATEDAYREVGAAYAGMDNNGIVRVRKEFVRKDGSHIWMEMNGTVLDKERDEMLWIAVDVTERILAEQNQRRLARAVELKSRCASALVRAGREQELLVEICRLTVETGGYMMAWVGYAQQDAAKRILQVAKAGRDDGYVENAHFTWDDTEHGRGPLGTAVTSAATVVIQEFQTHPSTLPWREAASRRGFKASIALPLVVGGRVLGALAIYAGEAYAFGKEEVALLEELAADLAYGVQALRTRAERLAAEHALQESMHKLEEKEQAKTRFLAAAGHDMRQPLAAANLFIDALKLTDPTPKQEEIIGRLDQSMTTFNGLLESLLNVSKLDVGMVKPEITSIDVTGIFNWLEQNYEPLASKKHLQFKLSFPMREAIVVRGDVGLVRSVLMNLVSNAVKYTAAGGILISVRKRGGEALFQVWDTGMGIPQEFVGRIFDEFYQVNNPQRDRTRGLGLGLSIAKRALALLGGEIACRSRPGRGSVFEFRLPLAGNAALREPPPAAPETAIDISFARNKRFVVVEDDALVSQAMVNLLEGMGAEVRLFATGEEALRDAQACTADYFISDYMLGGALNGIEFLNRLRRQRGRPINAVLLTGDTSRALYVELTDCPWRMVHKPVKLAELLAVLRAQEA